MTHEPSPSPRRSGKRRAVWAAAAALAVAVAAGGGWFIATTGGDGQQTGATNLPPATAKVIKEDLADSEQVDGTLGYGDEHLATSGLPGVITWQPTEGSTVTRGKPLYKIDNLPVVLMYGSLPPYRTLKTGVGDGADIEDLERNLDALGYDGITVDQAWSSSTTDAVKAWQEDLGLPQTGRVDLGRVVMAPASVRVTEQKAQVGARTVPGQPVLTYTGTARVVSIDLDVSNQGLARKGAKVTVTLPDNKKTKGTVSTVGTVAHQTSGQSSSGNPPNSTQDGATIDVTVTLDDPKAAGTLDSAPVDVDFVSELHKGVLTVPVASLLALREGGYGVELVEGSTTRLVAVEVGLFAGGRVEVKGADIAEGMNVGVPKQ
jgi:peptidoglycan hydrolase-like protein with peptidoglycan-binding domain